VIEARLTRSECLRRLGLDTTAKAPQIRRAYRRLVVQFHPKRYRTQWLSNHRYVAIVAAYRELMQREKERPVVTDRVRTFRPVEMPRGFAPADERGTFRSAERLRTFVLADGSGTFTLAERPAPFLRIDEWSTFGPAAERPRASARGDRPGTVTPAEAAIAAGLTLVDRLPPQVDFSRRYRHRRWSDRAGTILGCFLILVFLASSVVSCALIDEVTLLKLDSTDDGWKQQRPWYESSEPFVHVE
jgi:hypothetical protein